MTNDHAEKPRLLVVDDNDDVRGILAIYLQKNGYSVSEAVDGAAAVQMAQSLKPDLILLDVLLPKLDGIEVLKVLRQGSDNAEVPVVLMSAVLSMRDLKAETKKLNVSAFLEKPFQVRKVLELVGHTLQGARSSKEPSLPFPTRQSPQEVTGDRIQYKGPGLPQSGDIANWSVPALLQAIFVDSVTGKLTLRHEAIEKRIFFQNGLSVYAESSLHEETLGAHLLHRGRITQTQHAAAVTEMTRSGRHFGETLLKLGVLGPHDLFTELEAHLTSKVIQSFKWTEGSFLFEPGNEWKDDVIVARMKPGRIMLDGMQKFCAPGSLYTTLSVANDTQTFPLDASPYTQDQLGLTAQETRIMQLVKKRLEIGEIIRQVGNLDLVTTTLFALYMMEKLGFLPNKEEPAQHGEPQRANPSIVPPAPPSSLPGKEEHAKALLAEYLKFRTADYFKLLGIPRHASAEEITAAFKTRQERYHPNTLVGIDTGLVHEKIEELFVRVHEAYRTLIDSDLREKYILKIEGQAVRSPIATRLRPSRPTGMFGKKKPADTQLFNDATSLLRDGKYAQALDVLNQALSLQKELRYEAYHAWASYLTDPEHNRGSAEHTLRALQKEHPNEALIPYLLGNLELREDNSNTAEMFYEQAVRLDPQHIESARQLRILRRRAHSADQSGLFEIFKKK